MKYKNYSLGPISSWTLAAVIKYDLGVGKKNIFAESDLKLSSVSVGRMKALKGLHPVSFLQRFHNAQGEGLSWSEMVANQSFCCEGVFERIYSFMNTIRK